MATRIGLAGYGFGGRVFHAPLIAAAPGTELAGGITRPPGRRGRAAGRPPRPPALRRPPPPAPPRAGERRADRARAPPGPPAFGRPPARAAGGADAVATPPPADTPLPLMLEAIALGLAVVSDKPFALDADQAREAVAAAEAAGAVL